MPCPPILMTLPIPPLRLLETSLLPLLKQGLVALNISLSDNQQQLLLQYVALLNKWNKVYNLTAVREPERMIGLHILDSLAVMPHLSHTQRVLDVGTGGGLPGMALAIARADLHVTMLDSLQKKTTFVRQAIGELSLTNAAVICERVEQFNPAEKFDVVIANIIDGVLVRIQDALKARVKEGGWLVLSGIISEREKDFLAGFQLPHGKAWGQRLQKGDWLLYAVRL